MRDLTLASPPSLFLECSSRSRSRRWRWSWSCRTDGRASRATAARSLSDFQLRTCNPSGIDRRRLLVDFFWPAPMSAMTMRERRFDQTHRFLAAARAQTQDGEVVVGRRRRGTAAGVDFLLNARSFATIFHHRHLKSEESRRSSQICTPGTEFIQKLGDFRWKERLNAKFMEILAHWMLKLFKPFSSEYYVTFVWTRINFQPVSVSYRSRFVFVSYANFW